MDEITDDEHVQNIRATLQQMAQAAEVTAESLRQRPELRQRVLLDLAMLYGALQTAFLFVGPREQVAAMTVSFDNWRRLFDEYPGLRDDLAPELDALRRAIVESGLFPPPPAAPPVVLVPHRPR